MPHLTITVTDAQQRILKRIDPRKTADAVIQVHVDTWLAPLVSQASSVEADAVKAAYIAAPEPVRASVRAGLKLG